jgi:hypothetical protein
MVWVPPTVGTCVGALDMVTKGVTHRESALRIIRGDCLYLSTYEANGLIRADALCTTEVAVPAR